MYAKLCNDVIKHIMVIIIIQQILAKAKVSVAATFSCSKDDFKFSVTMAIFNTVLLDEMKITI